MKKHILLATAAAFVLTPALAQQTQQSDEMQQNQQSEAQGDLQAGMGGAEDFVTAAAMGDLFEIESARIAEQQAESEEVRQFAEQLLQDHSQSADQLAQAAEEAEIDVAILGRLEMEAAALDTEATGSAMDSSGATGSATGGAGASGSTTLGSAETGSDAEGSSSGGATGSIAGATDTETGTSGSITGGTGGSASGSAGLDTGGSATGSTADGSAGASGSTTLGSADTGSGASGSTTVGSAEMDSGASGAAGSGSAGSAGSTITGSTGTDMSGSASGSSGTASGSALQADAGGGAMLDAEHQDKLDELRAASGQEFDRTFLEMQIEAHEQAIEKFEQYAENGEEDALKRHAEQALPTLEEHLEHAQTLLDDLG